jgi:hypothetical protein
MIKEFIIIKLIIVLKNIINFDNLMSIVFDEDALQIGVDSFL